MSLESEVGSHYIVPTIQHFSLKTKCCFGGRKIQFGAFAFAVDDHMHDVYLVIKHIIHDISADINFTNGRHITDLDIAIGRFLIIFKADIIQHNRFAIRFDG